MKNIYIIAEIGINHNGDINLAKKLISIAAAAGCHAVKFQKRNPDICVPEHQKNVIRSTPWGEMTYLEYKHKIEFGKKEYDQINDCCKSYGIEWSASPWDEDSLNFLNQYNIPFIKLASASLTDLNLIEKSVSTGKKVIISTGMSTDSEVDQAVNVIRNAQSKFGNHNKMGLLHCNSSYPADICELNLSCITTLKNKYPDFTIGYSGHELTIGTTVSSIFLGAEIIERHITLNRNMWGSDHSCSVTPWGLFKMVNGIKELESSFGDGVISLSKSEQEISNKLRKINHNPL